LDGAGRDLYGKLPQFERIDVLHRQVHALGEEIIAKRKTAGAAGNRSSLTELHALRDALVVELRVLREVAAGS
jgi:hypothetical protein